MIDAARERTDAELREMEKHIRKIYRKAQKGIVKKWNDYMTESAAEIQSLQDAYDEAKRSGDKDLIKSTGKKLGIAKHAQTLKNEYYQKMVQAVAVQLANINAIALAYVNGRMPDIYALNYNAAAVDAELWGIDFTLVDEHTVKRLILGLTKKFDKKKDISWNTRQINSAVLQGILQGESIPEIAARIYPIVGKNEAAAIRNARTMTTAAECHGRLDSYHDLSDRGVVMKKVWIATPDDRTRPTHIDLDGEEQDIDDEFSNGCMFPGDGNGPAEEVWNCRCSIRTHIIGFRRADKSISRIDYKRDETLHDRQMAEERARREV